MCPLILRRKFQLLTEEQTAFSSHCSVRSNHCVFIVLISYLLVDFVPLFAFAEWVDNGFLLTGGGGGGAGNRG